MLSATLSLDSCSNPLQKRAVSVCSWSGGEDTEAWGGRVRLCMESGCRWSPIAGHLHFRCWKEEILKDRGQTCWNSIASCSALPGLTRAALTDFSRSPFSLNLVHAPVPSLTTLLWIFCSFDWLSQDHESKKARMEPWLSSLPGPLFLLFFSPALDVPGVSNYWRS